MDELVCFSCGASLADLTLPLRRLEECPACAAELHVCRMCQFYDVAVAKACREPIAEEVRDKVRANFCDYFTPRPGAYTPPDEAAAQARTELDALFGDDNEHATSSRDELEALFKKTNK